MVSSKPMSVHDEAHRQVSHTFADNDREAMRTHTALCFGTGSMAENVLPAIRQEVLEIMAYIDERPAMRGTTYKGRPIIGLSQITDYAFDYILVVCRPTEKVIDRLLTFGIPIEKIVALDVEKLLLEQNTADKKILCSTLSTYFQAFPGLLSAIDTSALLNSPWLEYIQKQIEKNRLNFVTFANLSEYIRKNINKLPSDIDLVVGIPRSGVIPAYMVALFLNKAACTLVEFLNNSTPAKGRRPIKVAEKKGRTKVLVVDDSILTGRALADVKKRLENNNSDDFEFIFLAIIATEESKNLVDYHFHIIAEPRVFQWNYMNHIFNSKSCMDMDGVLCIDPTHEQNDDGKKYIRFIENAKPLYIPSYKIYAIVTSRLEKYRNKTEEWLKINNVHYEYLYMLDLPNAQVRRQMKIHAAFKAEIYSKLKNTRLFIESEPQQARSIAELSGKPCICVSTDEYFEGKIFE